ncbi:MAG: hypothetical protein JKY81_01590 [Colwellia sp.]|nr:hypothetical protein [Colwellia sp.]
MDDFTQWSVWNKKRIITQIDSLSGKLSISQRRYMYQTLISELKKALKVLDGKKDIAQELDIKAWEELGSKHGDI